MSKKGAKADNSAKIASLNSLITAQRAKITALDDAIKKLREYDTNVDYELKSHSNIKETYELDGIPYSTMASEEKTLVDSVGTDFGGVRDDMVLDLVDMSRGMEMNISCWKSEISRLSE